MYCKEEGCLSCVTGRAMAGDTYDSGYLQEHELKEVTTVASGCCAGHSGPSALNPTHPFVQLYTHYRPYTTPIESPVTVL